MSGCAFDPVQIFESGAHGGLDDDIMSAYSLKVGLSGRGER